MTRSYLGFCLFKDIYISDCRDLTLLRVYWAMRSKWCI